MPRIAKKHKNKAKIRKKKARRQEGIMATLKDLLPIIIKNGFDISQASALEVFGGDGTLHTLKYADKVRSLDVWEIDPLMESKLKANLSGVGIIICNSYDQVKKNTVHYDMIVIDNPIQSHHGYCEKFPKIYCEHFDLFPDIFKILNDDCLLILNVIPNLIEDAKKQYPELKTKYHLNRRKAFYRAFDPEHITDDELTWTYNNLVRDNGFYIEWLLTLRRSFVYYLAMKLKRGNYGSN